MDISNGDVPKLLRLVMMFIDRVGFPILAFILMFYMSFYSIQRITVAITENTKAFTSFASSSSEVYKVIADNQKTIMSDLKTLMLLKPGG